MNQAPFDRTRINLLWIKAHLWHYLWSSRYKGDCLPVKQFGTYINWLTCEVSRPNLGPWLILEFSLFSKFFTIEVIQPLSSTFHNPSSHESWFPTFRRHFRAEPRYGLWRPTPRSFRLHFLTMICEFVPLSLRLTIVALGHLTLRTSDGEPLGRTIVHRGVSDVESGVSFGHATDISGNLSFRNCLLGKSDLALSWHQIKPEEYCQEPRSEERRLYW